MKNHLYICHTIYHLLITMVRLDESARNTVCLVDTIIDVDQIHARIAATGLFDGVIKLRAQDFIQNGGYQPEFIKTYADFFRTFDKVSIFNDDTYVAFFLHRQKISYHLIEDGYNYYQYYNLEDAKNYRNHMIKAHNDDFPIVRGYGEFCVSVESNDISSLPKDERYPKLIEVPRAKLFSELSDKKRQAIIQAFPIKEPSARRKSVLVLAQPLFKDGIMSSQKEQIDYYAEICRKYRLKYDVFFKAHPRDEVKFPKWWGVKTIEKSTPIEVLLLKSGFRFTKGITHSSTALEFLPNVDEKIVLVDLKK